MYNFFLKGGGGVIILILNKQCPHVQLGSYSSVSTGRKIHLCFRVRVCFCELDLVHKRLPAEPTTQEGRGRLASCHRAHRSTHLAKLALFDGLFAPQATEMFYNLYYLFKLLK